MEFSIFYDSTKPKPLRINVIADNGSQVIEFEPVFNALQDFVEAMKLRTEVGNDGQD
jgi:hypothetical protein